MSSNQLHILGNILIGRVEKKRSIGEVERRRSRERLEDYSRGDKVFYNVEERKCFIIYWNPGE
jgi:hypothetical protein